MFVLRLFGGLSLESRDHPVPTSALQRRRLSLLALLALAGERGVQRERVQRHLWPDTTPERARHALDQLLYTTRRDLGSDAVLSGPTELTLNDAVVRSDLGRFDAALRAQRWEEAVELHRGPLLDGVRLFEDADLERWIAIERARCEEEYRRALEALARAAQEGGRPADAVRWWRRRAAADPCSAPVAVALMRALAAGGDVAAAVAHAGIYERLARDEGTVPDPSVAACAAELAAAPARAPTIAAPSESSPTDATTDAHGEAPTEPAATPPPSLRTRQRRTLLQGAGLLAVAAIASLLVREVQGSIGLDAMRRSASSGDVALAAAAGGFAAGDAATRLDSATHAIFLRARARWEQRDRAGLEEAVTLYRATTERAPTFAPAFAGLALSYAMLGYFGFAPGDAMFPKARAAAERALALDPASGSALAALGQALAWEHDWANAERVYRRALEVAPADATVHQWYALLLAYLGRPTDAALHTGHATRLDPLSVQIGNMHGMMLYHAGRLDEALRHYERTVEAEPDSAWVRRNPWVLSNYARVAAAAGRREDAERLLARSIHAVPGHPRPLFDLVLVRLFAGDTLGARRAFAPTDVTHAHYPAYRALFHAALGERDVAFERLRRVQEMPLPATILLRNDPSMAAFRADPRFAPVLARLVAPRK